MIKNKLAKVVFGSTFLTAMMVPAIALAQETGDAALLGWDVTALGLPGAGLPFASGRFQQHLEVPGM